MKNLGWRIPTHFHFLILLKMYENRCNHHRSTIIHHGVTEGYGFGKYSHLFSRTFAKMSILRKEEDHISTAKHFQTSSPLEKCSFACHLFLFPIGLVYLFWLLVPEELLETPEAVTYYPNKDYALHIPVTALFLFLAAPFLYAAFNSLTVPDLNSLDAVEDVYTKSSSRTKLLSIKLPSPESTLPEICDLDPSTLIWYARNENIT